jgi:hypothetical protein
LPKASSEAILFAKILNVNWAEGIPKNSSEMMLSG